MIALAYFGFFINLFNLLPVMPLDGGRAAAAMTPWMWFLGFGVLVALAFLNPGNPILLIIVIFAGFRHITAGSSAKRARSSRPPTTASRPVTG